MAMGSPREILAMEAQADAWYHRIRDARVRLKDETLAEAERAKLTDDLARWERELARLDQAIDERRKHIGNPTW